MYAASYTKCKQERQCTYKNNIAARSRNCRRCATVRNITYFECVPVALVTQQATRMRHIILSSVACPPHTILFHITSQTARCWGKRYWI